MLKAPTIEEMFSQPEYVDYEDSSGGYIGSDVEYRYDNFIISHQEEEYGNDTHGWEAVMEYSYQKGNRTVFSSDLISVKCNSKEEAYESMVEYCDRKNKAILEERVVTLELMNDTMRSMNNEEAYYAWINVVPDEARPEDFQDIASSEKLYPDVTDFFERLIKKYKIDGIYNPSDETLKFVQQYDANIDVFGRKPELVKTDEGRKLSQAEELTKSSQSKDK